MLGAAVLTAATVAGCDVFRPKPHNLIIFVADGLRYAVVTPQTAPAMAGLKREGVDFTNSHAMFPTITTPNASAIATGHWLGDTGDFANATYAGAPALKPAFLSLVPFLEDDPVLGAMNSRFGGNYLGRDTLLAAARRAGFQTAAIGKVGPTAIQDVTARDGRSTIVIDDYTGQPEGLPLPRDVKAAIAKAGLDPATPDRGLNTDPGTFIMPGVRVANVEQQDWFSRVAAQVLLPRFKARGKPFAMVFWSRDPDGTQHNQGDSLGSLTPGINGPTSMAAIRNADTDLARLRAALAKLGLDKTTDILVTADHGFSVTSKQSATSAAAKGRYPDVRAGELPPGFLALDLGKALGLPVWEPAGLDIAALGHPKRASAILGKDPHNPDVVIGANGGSDQIWLPTPAGRAMAGRIVAALTGEDYASALFAASRLGRIPGALSMAEIAQEGAARTPEPDLIISFKHGATGCADPTVCGFDVADTELQQGQGIHGALGRADTRNFMAATGPDFRRGFVDPAPVSNADWAQTMAQALRLAEAERPGQAVGAGDGRDAGQTLGDPHCAQGARGVRARRQRLPDRPEQAGPGVGQLFRRGRAGRGALKRPSARRGQQPIAAPHLDPARVAIGAQQALGPQRRRRVVRLQEVAQAGNVAVLGEQKVEVRAHVDVSRCVAKAWSFAPQGGGFRAEALQNQGGREPACGGARSPCQAPAGCGGGISASSISAPRL